MSREVQRYVRRTSKARGTPFHVLLQLAYHADDDGTITVNPPSMDRLANELRISRRTVIRSILDLEQLTELVVGRQHGKENTYEIPKPGDKQSPLSGDTSGDRSDTTLSPPQNGNPLIGNAFPEDASIEEEEEEKSRRSSSSSSSSQPIQPKRVPDEEEFCLTREKARSIFNHRVGKDEIDSFNRSILRMYWGEFPLSKKQIRFLKLALRELKDCA